MQMIVTFSLSEFSVQSSAIMGGNEYCSLIMHTWSAMLSSHRQMENLVVVVQACLAMQLESITKHPLLAVHDAVANAPQTSMCCSHCTHSTRLLHHVAIKSRAQIRPAPQWRVWLDCNVHKRVSCITILEQCNVHDHWVATQHEPNSSNQYCVLEWVIGI